MNFFSSPADTCKSGSKFLQAYASCAQCATNVEPQPTQYMPDSLSPVLSYCKMRFQYNKTISGITMVPTSGNNVFFSTIFYYYIANLPTEPTAPITGIPPTTVAANQIPTALNTASSENSLPSKTPTIPQVTETPQAKVGNSNSTRTYWRLS